MAITQARHATHYDGRFLMEASQVRQVVAWAERLYLETEAWLQQHAPQVLRS